MLKLIWAGVAVLLIAKAADAQPVSQADVRARQANAQMLDSIYARLQVGVVPVVGEQPAYFTGRCIATSPSLDPLGSYYAILGLQKINGEIRTTWTVSYSSSPVPSENSFLERSLEQNARLYPVNYKAETRANTLYVAVSETSEGSPKLFYEISQDPQTPGQLLVVGSHIGFVGCLLNAL